MLLVAQSIPDLDFTQLMTVYREGNIENGEIFYPQFTLYEQLQLAEQDFYDFLRDFFRIPGAFYAIYQMDNHYMSALRMEPYQDGLLLEALETDPLYRRQGYAAALINETFTYLSKNAPCIVYSHVSCKNIPSIKVHEKAGFKKILDYAVYIDGSISTSADTWKCVIY